MNYRAIHTTSVVRILVEPKERRMWYEKVHSGLSFENNIRQMINKAKPHWMIEDIVEAQINT